MEDKFKFVLTNVSNSSFSSCFAAMFECTSIDNDPKTAQTNIANFRCFEKVIKLLNISNRIFHNNSQDHSYMEKALDVVKEIHEAGDTAR